MAGARGATAGGELRWLELEVRRLEVLCDGWSSRGDGWRCCAMAGARGWLEVRFDGWRCDVFCEASARVCDASDACEASTRVCDASDVCEASTRACEASDVCEESARVCDASDVCEASARIYEASDVCEASACVCEASDACESSARVCEASRMYHSRMGGLVSARRGFCRAVRASHAYPASGSIGVPALTPIETSGWRSGAATGPLSELSGVARMID